jgi:NAD(P)-dependent dehydrogenase (short-subunit alcohol dehydrogenase family)
MGSTNTRRRFILPLLGCLALAGFPSPAPTVEAIAPTVLITGANRGIGLALTSAYLARGWDVIATCRQPASADALVSMTREYPGLSIERLDVLDYAMIDRLAEKLSGQRIDILINNAGIRGPRDQQSFGALNYRSFEPVMATNTLAPLKMAEAFIDHVAGSELKKIITISSSLGSISRTFGGSYFYRASKTAVNMMMANLAKDVRDRGVIVGIVTPGYVDTDFTRGAGDQILKISPEESAAGMLPVIDGFSLETSGTLMRHTGEPLAW